jgi:hypothetical protein
VDIDCDPCKEDSSLPECKPLPPPPDRYCHPSYPDTCIPPPPPNLNCDDISFRNFKVIAITMALVVKVVAEVMGVAVLALEATAIAMVIMMEFPYLQMNVKNKLTASEVQ